MVGERERVGERWGGRERKSLAFWEDLMSSDLIFQPACPRVYNSQLVKACAVPGTTVH